LAEGVSEELRSLNVVEVVKSFLDRIVQEVELFRGNEKFYIANDLGPRYIGG
jgi:hypothetical protein